MCRVPLPAELRVCRGEDMEQGDDRTSFIPLPGTGAPPMAGGRGEGEPRGEREKEGGREREREMEEGRGKKREPNSRQRQHRECSHLYVCILSNLEGMKKFEALPQTFPGGWNWKTAVSVLLEELTQQHTLYPVSVHSSP